MSLFASIFTISAPLKMTGFFLSQSQKGISQTEKGISQSCYCWVTPNCFTCISYEAY
jgi:glycopeptide antibiotics resistance protein